MPDTGEKIIYINFKRNARLDCKVRVSRAVLLNAWLLLCILKSSYIYFYMLNEDFGLG